MVKEPAYLKSPTRPIEVKERRISDLVDAMRYTGFQGRKLGEAVEAWAEMLKERELAIFLGLSGAMVPAGMRKVIAFLVRERLVDCVVSTGANLFHDTAEALGTKHYMGSALADDEDLFRHGIDRMYDVFGLEGKFRETDRLVAKFAKTLDPGREYSSREFMHLFGLEVARRGGDKNSIVVSAAQGNVPVFVPALGDSSIGIGLMIARRKGLRINVSPMKDVDEITQIVEETRKSGVVYVGGGVPKNFIQQTEVITSILGLDLGGHEYAIQFTTDAPHWGGLSGCTFEEAVSWGKIDPVARKVQCFVDATIALPIVAHALREKAMGMKRRVPEFDWSGERLKARFKGRKIGKHGR